MSRIVNKLDKVKINYSKVYSLISTGISSGLYIKVWNKDHMYY